MEGAPSEGPLSLFWHLAFAAIFVAANAFFVSAEFALIKVSRSRLKTLAEQGSKRARTVLLLLTHFNRYLSACQLGITLASLALGWLAEPAIARVFLTTAARLGLPTVETGLVHGLSFALAFALITTIHMTLGELTPKIWSIHRAEKTALFIAVPLRIFTIVFRPLIWLVNGLSNLFLRVTGVSAKQDIDQPYSAEELQVLLSSSAHAGLITGRQREFAENILGIMDLEARHILVPRVDVVLISRRNTLEENLRIIRECGHSRLPFCENDLDSVIGIIHSKDVFGAIVDGKPLALEKMSRKISLIPDTQPLSRLIVDLQRTHRHCAIVVDEHGTAIGMVFLEDALEEIVGPIQDEFDQEAPQIEQVSPGVVEVQGNLALPEAVKLLDIEEEGEDDTIGGRVVSLLGRLPKRRDELTMGPYRVIVLDVMRNRVMRLRFEKMTSERITTQLRAAEPS